MYPARFVLELRQWGHSMRRCVSLSLRLAGCSLESQILDYVPVLVHFTTGPTYE